MTPYHDIRSAAYVKSCFTRHNVPGHRIPALATAFQQHAEWARQHEAYTDEVPLYSFRIPGRIEVLGKHTDYAGGMSLVCAIEQGLCITAFPSDEPVLTIWHEDFKTTSIFPLGQLPSTPMQAWETYPLTVLRRLQKNFGALRGTHLMISGDLPQAAGMSSSSALMVGLLLALATVNQLPAHPLWNSQIQDLYDLAMYASRIENGGTFGKLSGDSGVGTKGGSQDQTAILCCRPDVLSCFSYRPVQPVETVPIPEGYTFVIAHSGVLAEKAGAAMLRYNRAAQLAHAIPEVWHRATGLQAEHMGELLSAPGFDLYALWKAILQHHHPTFSDLDLQDRLDHFMEELRIVQDARKALKNNDLPLFGRCVLQSQHYAEKLLHNQVDETIFLASKARTLGALAASAFGAGFGGAVWAMVEDEHAAAFTQRWAYEYQLAFPEHQEKAQFFQTHAGPAAFGLFEGALV